KPVVSFQSGLSWQVQRRITGFPDATLFDVGLTTSLPFTDRNQGNILKAESQIRENSLTLQADLVDARAEVETAVSAYRVAYKRVSEDDPKMLPLARSVRDRIEAAFQAGQRSFVEVLDAQRTYRERLRTSISNQTDYWQSLNKLNAAVGVPALPSP